MNGAVVRRRSGPDRNGKFNFNFNFNFELEGEVVRSPARAGAIYSPRLNEFAVEIEIDL